MRFMTRFVLVGVITATVVAQSYPPAFPRTNATQLLETDRIVVWDIVWPRGQPTPLHRHVHDQVGTYYQSGGRIITSLDGAKRETTTAVGALSQTRKGTTHIEEGATDPPLRATASSGLTPIHPGEHDPRGASSRADTALDRAKQRGRTGSELEEQPAALAS